MITIREYDNTKSPVGAYANFTVLVPGYRDESKADPFGTDYAIELRSQEEFVKKIGKKAATAVARIPCKLTALAFNNDSETRVLPAGGTYYVGTVNDPATAGGYLDTGLMTFTSFVSDGYGSFKETDNIYIFARADDPDPSRTYATNAFIGNTLGQNPAEGGSYGNQFAYELLGLGYTVLYADIEKLVADYGTGTNSYIFKPFEDKAAYDFRYILNGFMNGSYNTEAITLANARQDCTALCDLDFREYTDGTLKTMSSKITAIQSLATGLMSGKIGKYTALFANRPTYKMADDAVYNNKTFACGFHYLACAAKAAENFAEWYAVGGYTRGISNYTIDKLDINLGDAAVDALQPRNGKDWPNEVANCVNIMVKIKGQSLLWGNNTAEALQTDRSNEDNDTLKASHFLNIRQLCTTIKKQVYVTCRRLTFNPNSSRLWSDFKGMVEPTLALAKSDQGCDDYLMTRVQDSRKAMMTAKIRIVPIEAVKDFDISLFLEDSISGVVIGEDESAD